MSGSLRLLLGPNEFFNTRRDGSEYLDRLIPIKPVVSGV